VCVYVCSSIHIYMLLDAAHCMRRPAQVCRVTYLLRPMSMNVLAREAVLACPSWLASHGRTTRLLSPYLMEWKRCVSTKGDRSRQRVSRQGQPCKAV
jgi:hypothetical protein